MTMPDPKIEPGAFNFNLKALVLTEEPVAQQGPLDSTLTPWSEINDLFDSSF